MKKRISLIVRDLPTLPLDQSTATFYATVHQELKLQGTPLPWHDVWIAAQARKYGVAILSKDAHFDSVAKIRRVGW